MDSDTYLKWLEFRLLPTLRQLYPGKRYIFVLDNAKYHKVKVGNGKDKYKCFSSMSKPELAKVLADWKVSEFTCTRILNTAALVPQTEDRKFVTADFTKRESSKRGKGGPTAKELLRVVQQHKSTIQSTS